MAALSTTTQSFKSRVTLFLALQIPAAPSPASALTLTLFVTPQLFSHLPKHPTDDTDDSRPRDQNKQQEPCSLDILSAFPTSLHQPSGANGRLLSLPLSSLLRALSPPPSSLNNMGRGSEKDDRATYDKFAALLSPPSQGQSRHRSASEIADGMKRIRRLILTDGIPEVVSGVKLRKRFELTNRRAARHFDRGYGSCSSASSSCMLRTTSGMWRLAPARRRRRVSQVGALRSDMSCRTPP